MFCPFSLQHYYIGGINNSRLRLAGKKKESNSDAPSAQDITHLNFIYVIPEFYNYISAFNNLIQVIGKASQYAIAKVFFSCQ